MKKIFISLVIILVVVLGIALVVLVLPNKNSNEVNFYFFPLEEADASIIAYKEKIVMIDTGEQKDQDQIEKELKNRQVKKIDYLILTHPDKDHIGNAQFLIENYEIGEVFQTDYAKESELQENLNKAIEERKIKNEILKEKTELQIEELKMQILPPNIQYEDSNNNSLIVIMEYNGKKALYTGDIREERMQDILEELEEVDLLKYPYHGRKNTLSRDFIQRTKPKMTIITGNSPDKDIIQELKNIGSKIRYTSEQSVEIIFE